MEINTKKGLAFFNIVCFVLLLNNSVYSQAENSRKITTSEIVFLKDSYLKSTVKKIIEKDKLCPANNLKWGIEFMKGNLVLITRYSLGNLIEAEGIANIYTTIIDDKIIFLFSKENISEVFVKSGYSIDLSYFIDKGSFSIIDYSFWVVQQKNGKKYKIIKEKKYSCKY